MIRSIVVGRFGIATAAVRGTLVAVPLLGLLVAGCGPVADEYYGAAVNLIGHKEYDRAIRGFRVVLGLGSHSAFTHVLIGDCYLGKASVDEAIEGVHRSHRARPATLGHAYITPLACLGEECEHAKAEADCARAVKASPSVQFTSWTARDRPTRRQASSTRF